MGKGVPEGAVARRDPLRLLVVEDDPADAELFLAELKRAGMEAGADVVRTPKEFEERLRSTMYDVVLSDYNLSAWTGIEALGRLQETKKNIPFILVTSMLDHERALECIKRGAADYVLKNHLARLPTTIEQALREKLQREQATHLQEKLSRGKREWELTFDTIPDPVYLLDENCRIRRANRAAAEVFGLDFGDLIGRTCYEALHRCPEPRPDCPHQLLRRTGKPARVVLAEPRLDKVFDASTTPIHDPEGIFRGSIHVLHDVTEQKRAEKLLARTNRALRTLSECNQTIVQATREAELLKEMCRVIVEVGGYRMAWVGFAEADNNRTVRPVAQAGIEEGYLKSAVVSWGDRERGRGPVGRAIRDGVPVVSQDILSDPSFHPWREEARRRGYASVIALPLQTDREAFGCLVIYAGEPDAFDQDETSLLKEMAADLGYAIGAVRTRAAREQAEESLRLSEERYRELVQGLDAIVWEGEADTFQFTFVSRRAKEVLGYPLKQWLQKPDFWISHLHPEDRERTLARYKRAATEPKVQAIEYRMIAADGRLVWLRDSVRLVSKGPGRSGHLRGVMIDITERKQAEEKLQERTTYLNCLLESAPLGIVILDAQGRVRMCNPAFEELFQYHQDEVAGRALDEFIAPENRGGEAAEFTRRVYRGQNLHAVTRRQRKDGTLVDVEVYGVSLRANGNLIGSYGLYQDISERKQAEKALRESERTLSTLMSNLPGMAYRCRKDRHWTMEFVSEGCQELTGYDPSGLVGNRRISYAQIIHPDDRENVWDQVNVALRQKRPFRLVYRIYTANGEEKWVWEQGRGVFSSRGKLQAIEGFIADISERKRAEERLRQSTEILRALVEASPVAIVALAPDGTVRQWNPAAERIFGWSEQEVLGKPFPIIPPGRESDFRALMERILQGETLSEVERQRQRKDGTPIDISISAAPLRDAEGYIGGVMGAMLDVTERKRVEKRLQEHTAYLNALIENTPLAIAALDSQHRVRMINPAFERLFQYRPAEVIGRKLEECLAPEGFAGEVVEFMQRVLAGEIVHATTRRRRKDASVVGVELYDVPLMVGEELLGIYTLYQDVTERKRAEEERLRFLQLQADNEALARADQLKSEFLANMSHEFRTPLNSILGFSELLLEGGRGLSPRQREDLDIVHRKAEHLLALVNDLLDLSHIESGQVQLEPTPVRVRDCLLSLLDAFSVRLQEKALQGAVEVEPAELQLVADPRRLEQIVTNLLANAVRFTQQGGISLRAQAQDGHVLVSVQDTGVGIASQDLEHVFDKFYQARQQAEGAKQGTGLGLAITKQLVELHGGRIWVESTPGQGTCFFFTLPQRQGSHEAGST